MDDDVEIAMTEPLADIDRLRKRLADAREDDIPDLAALLGRALHHSDPRRWRGQISVVRRVVVGLLQYAVDHNHRTEFWVTYAEAQLRLWRHTGGSSLRAASEGWRRVEALAPVMEPEWLAERAELFVYLGDYAAATMQLGKLLENPDAENETRRPVILRVAMLYQHGLKHHAQAIALIYRLVAAGGVSALSSVDLLFLLSRAYECWSRELDTEARGVTDEATDEAIDKRREAEAAAATAEGMFAKLYSSLKALGLAQRDVSAWLNSATTWRDIGDKCSFAGFDMFAADLYEEGARRDIARAGRAHWLRLAKAERRCGRDRFARDALKRARDLHGETDAQLDALERTWDASDLPAADLKSLLDALPRDQDPTAKAATVIATRVRGCTQRLRGRVPQSTRSIAIDEEPVVRRPASRDACVEIYMPWPPEPDRSDAAAGSDSPFMLENTAASAFAPAARVDVATTTCSEPALPDGAPVPSEPPQDLFVLAEADASRAYDDVVMRSADAIELSRLRVERNDIVRRVQAMQDALDASQEALATVAALQDNAKRCADEAVARYWLSPTSFDDRASQTSLVQRASVAPVPSVLPWETTTTTTTLQRVEAPAPAPSSDIALTISLEAVTEERDLLVATIRERDAQIASLEAKVKVARVALEQSVIKRKAEATAARAQLLSHDAISAAATRLVGKQHAAELSAARAETRAARSCEGDALHRIASLKQDVEELQERARRLVTRHNARSRADGRVLFARAVKVDERHLMVKITSRDKILRVRALDVAQGRVYDLALEPADWAPFGDDRLGANQIARRLEIIAHGGLRVAGTLTVSDRALAATTAGIVASRGLAVAVSVCAERTRGNAIRDQAVAACRSVALASRAVTNGADKACKTYLARMQSHIDHAERTMATGVVAASFRAALFLERRLFECGPPARRDEAPREARMRDLADASLACDEDMPAAPEEDDVVAVEEPAVREPPPFKEDSLRPESTHERESLSIENSALSAAPMPPYAPPEWATKPQVWLPRVVEPVVPNGSDAAEKDTSQRSIAQYRRLGYLPKTEVETGYVARWRALLREARVARKSLVALRRDFRALPTDVVYCALAETGDVEGARAKLADPCYVQELLVVVAALDSEALVPQNLFPETTTSGVLPPVRRHKQTRPSKRHQQTAMRRLANTHHRSIRHGDLSSEVDTLLSSSSSTATVVTKQASLLRRKHLRHLQHDFGGDIDRVDPWKAGPDRNTHQFLFYSP